MELLKQAMRLNAETLNKSFNYFKINDPNQTFYTSEYVKKFIKSKELSSIIILTELELCEEYAKYLSIHLTKAHKDIFTYLKDISDSWKLKDTAIKEDNSLLYLYVIKKFIISPVSGYYLENQVKKQFLDNIRVNELNIQLQDSTVKEDAEQCIDFFLKSDTLNVGMQVKPLSFFKSVKTTSKYSLQKIKHASVSANNIIFICTIEYSIVKIAFRNKYSKNWQFIEISTFLQIMQYNFDQVKTVCYTTFQQLEA